MAIDFPNSPATNDTYTVGNKTWIYDGTTWNGYNTTSFSAETLPGTTLKSTVTGSSLTSVGTLSSLTVTNESTINSALNVTTVLAAGRGLNVRADPTNTYGIIQFTNNAVSAQWSSIVATNNLINVSTPLTVTGTVSPTATNTYDLGTAALRWRNIYTQDLHLSNGIGDYTVVEGEENLYLVNNKTNKSFKFALIEVDSSEVPKLSET